MRALVIEPRGLHVGFVRLRASPEVSAARLATSGESGARLAKGPESAWPVHSPGLPNDRLVWPALLTSLEIITQYSPMQVCALDARGRVFSAGFHDDALSSIQKGATPPSCASQSVKPLLRRTHHEHGPDLTDLWRYQTVAQYQLPGLLRRNITSNMSKEDDLPNYGPVDYVKFFGAGALAATLTHGVRQPGHPSAKLRTTSMLGT